MTDPKQESYKQGGPTLGQTSSQRNAANQGSQRASGETGVGEQAKQIAGNVAEQAKDLVSHQIEQRSSKSAAELAKLASALRLTSQQLEGSVASPYVGKAADQVERVSNYLKDTKPSDVLQQAQRFARREPLLMLGGAFALGIIGARFLKSSGESMQAGNGAREGTRNPVQTVIPRQVGYAPESTEWRP